MSIAQQCHPFDTEIAKLKLREVVEDLKGFSDLPDQLQTSEDVEIAFFKRQIDIMTIMFRLRDIRNAIQSSNVITNDTKEAADKDCVKIRKQLRVQEDLACLWYKRVVPAPLGLGEFPVEWEPGSEMDMKVHMQIMQEVKLSITKMAGLGFTFDEEQVEYLRVSLNALIAIFRDPTPLRKGPTAELPVYFTNRTVYRKSLAILIPTVERHFKILKPEGEFPQWLREKDYSDMLGYFRKAGNVLALMNEIDDRWYRSQTKELRQQILDVGRQSRQPDEQNVAASTPGSIPTLDSICSSTNSMSISDSGQSSSSSGDEPLPWPTGRLDKQCKATKGVDSILASCVGHVGTFDRPWIEFVSELLHRTVEIFKNLDSMNSVPEDEAPRYFAGCISDSNHILPLLRTLETRIESQKSGKIPAEVSQQQWDDLLDNLQLAKYAVKGVAHAHVQWHNSQPLELRQTICKLLGAKENNFLLDPPSPSGLQAEASPDPVFIGSAKSKGSSRAAS